MNRQFEGIYQIAKQRYNLYYVTSYREDSCVLKIFRDGKLAILVSEDSQKRMYDVAADRLKSYVSINERGHAESSTGKERSD